MKLKKVTIDNFRNISHAEHNLEDLNVFQGPNRQGKTNTILAIYWAITDFLMDGSSDYASFKPLDDTKKKVSVELEFDTFKFKKEYFEKWTKTRGSETETMTGHYTDYYIDDIKTAPTNAKKDLIQKFGVEGKTNVSKFDLLRAIIDPYYLAKNDWKVTRQFIIELVGDVENTAVINENPELEPVANRLAQDWYNTDQTKKYYKQQINNSNDDITRLEGQIEGLKTSTRQLPTQRLVRKIHRSPMHFRRNLQNCNNRRLIWKRPREPSIMRRTRVLEKHEQMLKLRLQRRRKQKTTPETRLFESIMKQQIST